MSRLKDVALIVPALCASVALAAAFGGPALAQTTPPQARRSPPPSTPRQPQQAATPDAPTRARDAQADANADVLITARVTAESLRFERVPNPRVEFTGRPERATVWQAERENLPQEVRPGVTYRNIGITLRITSVFADIDRIVAEALGEVPADEARPTPASPSPAPPEQPGAQNRETTSEPSPPAARQVPQPTPAAAAHPAQKPAGPGLTPRRRAPARGGRVE